jgi:tetratricopeptide (TPR) repeat protein
MRASSSLFVVGILFSFCVLKLAQANPVLIESVRTLRNSLAVNDPSRAQLNLRLADLLFNEFTTLAKKESRTSEENRKMNSYRTESLELYETAASKSNSAVKVKIQFQVARIRMEAGDQARAMAIFSELSKQDESREIKREAILRLAENAEAKSASSVDAENYYNMALSICDGTDLCSYIHYRRAWILKNRGKMPEAIQEMKTALWDSKNQLREEALRDLIVFMGADEASSTQSLAYVDEVAAKISRPALLQDLAESYFTAGHKRAGAQALEFVNQRRPSIKNEARLAEEYYGFRNWDAFRSKLQTLDSMAESESSREQLSQSNLDSLETEKILRRLMIQLDGERVTKTEVTEDFKRTALTYLKLYPNHKERTKVIEGWVAAEKDDAIKLTYLSDTVA